MSQRPSAHLHEPVAAAVVATDVLSFEQVLVQHMPTLADRRRIEAGEREPLAAHPRIAHRAPTIRPPLGMMIPPGVRCSPSGWPGRSSTVVARVGSRTWRL